METQVDRPITEEDLYQGFNPLTRAVLKGWKRWVVQIDPRPGTQAALRSLDAHLTTGDAVVFIDHHYAFDALPLALGLGGVLKQVCGVLIPYAAHLDMRVDPQGWPSLRYRLRTWAFHKLVQGIERGAPGVRFLPIARDFELANPRLSAILDRMHQGVNTRYLRALVEMFTQHPVGYVCMLAPMAGLALPHKPVLHPQLYRSLEMVQARYSGGLPFYFVGAYPRWNVHLNYFAPLLARHLLVALERFELPRGDYARASEAVAEQLSVLRRTAGFVEPDYSRIKHK